MRIPLQTYDCKYSYLNHLTSFSLNCIEIILLKKTVQIFLFNYKYLDTNLLLLLFINLLLIFEKVNNLLNADHQSSFEFLLSRVSHLFEFYISHPSSFSLIHSSPIFILLCFFPLLNLLFVDYSAKNLSVDFTLLSS